MKSSLRAESFWIATAVLAVSQIGIPGCASTPAKTVAPTAPPEQVAAANAPAAAPAVQVAAADKAASAENPYPGSRMRDGPNGQKLYCMKEVESGERIARERCYTELAMEQLKASKREQIEKMRENSGYGTDGGH